MTTSRRLSCDGFNFRRHTIFLFVFIFIFVRVKDSLSLQYKQTHAIEVDGYTPDECTQQIITQR